MTKALEQVRQEMLAVFDAGLQAVKGDAAVQTTLQEQAYQQPCHVIALGKAAEAMFKGAQAHLGELIQSALVISKYDHLSDELKQNEQVMTLESAHPVPDEASLAAGERLTQYVQQLPAGEPCVFLISGGASSLVESLESGWDLARLQQLTQYLLSNAYDIHAINAVRQRVSRIKGGKLWKFIGDRSVNCLMISDVEGDLPSSIGSGLLFPPVQDHAPEDLISEWQEQLPAFTTNQVSDDFCWRIIASNDLALLAMQAQAQILGYDVAIAEPFLTGLAVEEAQRCIQTLQQSSQQMLLWGGETTVLLPENPGQGGRNQHFALLAAMHLPSDSKMCWLAAGTDGSDGLSPDTGALIDPETIRRGEQEGLNAHHCLAQADSGRFFAASGDLIHTGATGTNVMDVVIGVKLPH